jgi:hypothetical protein
VPTLALIKDLTKCQYAMLGNDKETLRLLAPHATTIANIKGSIGVAMRSLRKQDTPLGKIEQAFMTYVEALEDANLPRNYLQNPQDPSTIAYSRFWDERIQYQSSSIAVLRMHFSSEYTRFYGRHKLYPFRGSTSNEPS